MSIEINRERLAATFTELCEISSPSKKEGRIARRLKNIFSKIRADFILEDGSAEITGSEAGNLIIRFDGNLPERDSIFLACHMDTVEPGEGVEVLRTGDIFTSKGDTILGGDDKSGIAAIIELLTLLKENNTGHATIEVIITTCEEIGLLGAKSLEHDKIQSKFGYALDSSGINDIIIGAPAANKIKVEISGVAAHAGLCPEAGINALALAAQALTEISQGRIDKDTTRNFGLIQGGVATNIVPEYVSLKGEIRSHSTEKLMAYTQEVTDIFNTTIKQWKGTDATGDKRPSVKTTITDDYPILSLPDDSPVIQRVKEASKICGKNLQYTITGGGSDASIFSSYGLPTAIIATGMKNVHTVDEQLDLKDLVELTELLHALTSFSA